MKTTNWQTKALALFIAAVALCLTAACGNEYADILGLEPCVDDIDFNELIIVESISPPFSVGLGNDWSLGVDEYSYRDPDKAVKDAGKVVLEHEERFRAIPEFVYVVVNRLSLRDLDTEIMERWSIKHGFIVYINYPGEVGREDYHRWLTGCLDGYPVLAANSFDAMYATDAMVPIRWSEE